MTYPWTGPTAWNGTDQWPGPDSGGGPLTLTTTPQPDNVPPRVRVDVNDLTATLTSVTVTRLDPDGRWRNVRTIDGNPLSLSDGSGTVYDNECPSGVPVTYTTDAAGSPSVGAFLDVAQPWLQHPGIPSLSMPVDLRVGSNDAVTYGVQRGVFRPMGRKFPIIVTSGARQAGSSTLILSIDSEQQETKLAALLADTSILLLNVPPSLGLGIPTCYISVDAQQVRRRPGAVGGDPGRDVELPYDEVDWPAGGTRSSWTMADIRDNYATMADIRDAFPKMRDIAAGV